MMAHERRDRAGSTPGDGRRGRQGTARSARRRGRAAVADLVDRRAVDRLWAGDHTLWQRRPHRDRRPARLAARGRRGARRPASGSTASPTRRPPTASTHVGRHGHGRLEPVPRGARPHVPAAGGPPAPPRARHHRPGRHRPGRPRVPARRDALRRLVEVGLHDRDPQPPRARSGHAVGRPEQFAVITDPGSALGDAGPRARASRDVFENRPDIGGRYSALSLLRHRARPRWPASTGRRSLARRRDAASRRCGPTSTRPATPALRLGAVHRRRRCRPAATSSRSSSTRTIDDVRAVARAAAWPSRTGKHGTGVVPIVGEPLGPPERLRRRPPVRRHRRADRRPRRAGRRRPPRGRARPSTARSTSGGQVLLWELATALCGAVLGINPFDQPERGRGQGGHRRRCSPRARADDPGRRRWPTCSTRSARRLRRHPGLRRSRRPAWSTASRRPASRSATGSASPPPSGSAPASCTPPASSTRAARPRACSSRWSATTTTDVADPRASPSRSPTSSRPRPPATCRTLRGHGLRAGRVDPRRPPGGVPMKLGMVGLGPHGRQHGRAAAPPRPRGGRLRPASARAPTSPHLAELVAAARRRRPAAVVWVMVPAGDPTEDTIDELAGAAVAGRRRRRRRQLELARLACAAPTLLAEQGHRLRRRRHERRRVGPRRRATASWSAATAEDVAARAAGLRRRWRPRAASPTSGPAGTGHFTKMVHNGIEYGLMQAYAEGYELLERVRTSTSTRTAAFERVAAGQRRALVAARPARARPRADDPASRASRRSPPTRARAAGRCNEAVALGVAAPVISAALFARFVSPGRGRASAMKVIAALRQQFGGHAVEPETRRTGEPRTDARRSTATMPRRPRPTRWCSSAPPATWPRRRSSRRVYEMHEGGHDSTCRSSASRRRSGTTTHPRRATPARPSRLRARRRRERLERLRERISYVPGDYRDADVVRGAGRRALEGRQRAPALLPGHPAGAVRRRDRRAARRGPHRGRLGSSSRSRSGATWRRPAELNDVPPPGVPGGRRSSASTTSSARSRSRTCSCSASPTRCSSRCGTATSSPACRSRWPRSFGVGGPRASSTRRSARCATSCRTTSCRSSRCSPWSRRSAPTPTRCATRR